MPKKNKNQIQKDSGITIRQQNILFAVINEYCNTGVGVGSKEIKDKYNFDVSSATIRNELSALRDLGYLYQPFTNASSQPTDKAYRLFINQLITGLKIASRQQKQLEEQILEMNQKQANLSKEISRLLALQAGAVGFSLSDRNESISGISSLVEQSDSGRVVDILDFLDNLDTHKQKLLTSSKDDNQKLLTLIGGDGEEQILPLSKGYGMVAAKVNVDGVQSVVGLIAPNRLIANKKNLELVEALNKSLNKKDLDKESGKSES